MTDRTTRRQIRADYQMIQTSMRNYVGPGEGLEEAKDRLAALEEPLSYLIGDRGFEEFVEHRLEQYREESEKTLCSCWRATCPLKRGEVPPKIRQHGTGLTGRRPPSELTTEYLNHHDGGEALKLIRQEWGQMAVAVDLEFAAIKSVLSGEGLPETHEEIKRNLGVANHVDSEEGETAGAD